MKYFKENEKMRKKVPRSSRLRLLTLFLLLAICTAAAPGYKLVEIEGDYSKLGAGVAGEEIAWRNFEHFFESEHVYFISRLEQGYWLTAMVFTFKYGPRKRWGIYARLVSDTGENYLIKKEIKSKNVRLSHERLYWKHGDSLVEGYYPEYKLKIRAKEVSVDLTFHNRMKGWGFGKWYYDREEGKFSEVYMTVPWGKVAGTMTVKGKKMKVSGVGYSDRVHGNLPFYRTDPLFYGIRALEPMPGSEKVSIHAAYNHFHPAYGKIYNANVFIMGEDGFVRATPHVNIIPRDPMMHEELELEFPRKLIVHAREGDFELNGVFTANKPVEVMDIFQELPFYIRKIAELFWKRPVFSKWEGRFKGSYTINGKEKNFDILGIAEVNYTESLEMKK